MNPLNDGEHFKLRLIEITVKNKDIRNFYSIHLHLRFWLVDRILAYTLMSGVLLRIKNKGMWT